MQYEIYVSMVEVSSCTVCIQVYVCMCMYIIKKVIHSSYRSLRHPTLVNVQTIFEANTEAVKMHDQRGWLPIHWCAYNCRETSVMKMLIRQNDEGCFMANKKGYTSMCMYVCMDVCMYLLSVPVFLF